MKQKSKELDVDFIGGQGALTKDEEIAISEFIRAKKGGSERSAGKENKGKRAKETA